MENEQHRYELRSGSRSRSQTPSVQSRVTTEPEPPEHHYDLRRRSRERSRTPGEAATGKKSGTRSLPSSIGKGRDQNMQPVAEAKEESTVESRSENQSRRSTDSTPIATRKVERRSERQKSKKQGFANGRNELEEDSTSRKIERKRKSISPRRILTSDYSSEEGERDDPPSRPGSAYEIYKQAGEWWNVFPKTDYTYSQTSQYRYEIAPGVLAMPNMSRRSLHADGQGFALPRGAPSTSQQNLSRLSKGRKESDSAETRRHAASAPNEEISQNSTVIEESCNSDYSSAKSTMLAKAHIQQYSHHREVVYIDDTPTSIERQRQRSTPPSNLSSKFAESRKCGVRPHADSDTELEEALAVPGERVAQAWKISRLFSSVSTALVLWFSKVLEFLKLRTVRRREYRATYEYQRYYESKWTRLWRRVDRSSQYIYFFVVKIFFFDSRLLSSVSSVRRRLHERGGKVAWILLLVPLLLLFGCWCLPCMQRGTSFVESFLQRTGEILSSNARSDEFADRRLSAPPGKEDPKDLDSLVERLRSRVEQLERESVEQTERLANVTRRLVGRSAENDADLLAEYNRKVTVLEEKLDRRDHCEADVRGMETIKLEFESLKEQCSYLKSCCDSRVKEFGREDAPEKDTESVVADYFGRAITTKDFSRILQSLVLTDDPQNVESAEKKLGDRILSQLTDARVREIVKDALKVYDADKTGRVDYALESAGGQIISTRCTQRYDLKTRAIKILSFTLYHENDNPRTVIQGNPIQPGACWAFQGFPGYLLIKLRSFVYVTGFTLEHAPKSILPNGEMKSAPRKFNVWGLTDELDPEPVLFGDYEFVDSEESLQYFPVQNTAIAKAFEYIELRVHSNHGQLEYTCLYRFRVHGKPA